MKFFSKKTKQPYHQNNGMMNLDKREIMKALTAISIEKVLLDIGKPILDKVAVELQKRYRCYIPDCYEHPEYLVTVLKSIFGDSYYKIVGSIQTELQEYTYDQGVLELINTIVR